MTTTQVRRATGPREAPTGRRPGASFPPRVDPAFFEGRSWAWRSTTCVAGPTSFQVSSEWPGLADVLAPVTTSLQGRAELSTSHYRIVRQENHPISCALYYDAARVAVSRRPEKLVRYLTWHINRQMIQRSCEEHVVLHAAAATRAGLTVILPGGQEYGKTTTVAGLLRAGYDYVTDEAVAIDPRTLAITPFPKALSIDDGAWPLFPECRPSWVDTELAQWQVPAERLGSRRLTGTVLPPKIVVFPRYVPGARTAITHVSPGEAARQLAECTFNFQDQPGRNLTTLGSLVRNATVARLRIGSLDDAVHAVEELVSQTLIEELSR